jgi:hypothetical protein
MLPPVTDADWWAQPSKKSAPASASRTHLRSRVTMPSSIPTNDSPAFELSRNLRLIRLRVGG